MINDSKELRRGTSRIEEPRFGHVALEGARKLRVDGPRMKRHADDVAGATLVSASTRAKSLRSQLPNGGNQKAAEVIGEAIAKEALSVGIKCVCFDRGSYKFHGRTKALAGAARKAGNN